MNNVQDVRAFGRDYSGMAIAIIILAGIHVILSLVFSVMAYRKGLRKEGSAWLLSLGVCVAILVLAAVATGQKDNYECVDECHGTDCTDFGKYCMPGHPGNPSNYYPYKCVEGKDGKFTWVEQPPTKTWVGYPSGTSISKVGGYHLQPPPGAVWDGPTCAPSSWVDGDPSKGLIPCSPSNDNCFSGDEGGGGGAQDFGTCCVGHGPFGGHTSYYQCLSPPKITQTLNPGTAPPCHEHPETGTLCPCDMLV